MKTLGHFREYADRLICPKEKSGLPKVALHQIQYSFVHPDNSDNLCFFSKYRSTLFRL